MTAMLLRGYPEEANWVVNTASAVKQGHQKMYLTVLLEGAPYNKEIDTGSAKSIIAWSTLKQLLPAISRRQLNPSKYRLRDYQGNSIEIVGSGEFQVEHANFKRTLPLIVVADPLATLLGLD